MNVAKPNIPPHLPVEFYDKTETRRKIRQAAYAARVSPDGLLVAVLCRVAASLPPKYQLPNDGSLNFVGGLVGVTGGGKSKTLRAARRLVPEIGTKYDGVGIGSGEGIASLLERLLEDPTTRPSALFEVDEGEALLKVSGREGNVTLPTVRSAWSGQSLGQTNSTKERTRHVPANSYRFSLVAGFQPVVLARFLGGTYRAVGDPQRFLFAGVRHPVIPDERPPFPEPISLPLAGFDLSAEVVVDVDPDVLRIISRYEVAVARGEVEVDPDDSHRHFLTLKTAGLLSALESDGTVTPAVWADAWQVVDLSRAIRTWGRELTAGEEAAKEAAEEAKGIGKAIRREAATDDDRYNRYRLSMAGSMIRKARNERRPLKRRELEHATAPKHRAVVTVDDAIYHAVKVGTSDGRLRRLDDGDYEYVG